MKSNLTNRYTAIAFISVLSVVFFAGCYQPERERCEPVIVWKRPDTYYGNTLPDGICRYGYLFYKTSIEVVQFMDSCNKYNVGDTIVGQKKHY